MSAARLFCPLGPALWQTHYRHKVQGRLLPARNVHSGVDMGRSTSVYFFCLAMDPIFVALNQFARVLLSLAVLMILLLLGTKRTLSG